MKALVVLLALSSVALTSACGHPYEQATSRQSADGMTAYLGVMPAAVVRAHPPTHIEGSMHPSEPGGNAHLLVALFDDASGARIEDAALEATIRGERHPGSFQLRLERMEVEGTITYGGFTTLAEDDRYHIDVAVQRGQSQHATHLSFLFDAQLLSGSREPT